MTFEQMQKAKLKAVDEILASAERTILKAYSTRLAEVSDIVKTNYAKYLTGVGKADYYTTLALYNRLKTMDKDIKAVYVSLAKEVGTTIISPQYSVYDTSYGMSRYSMAFFSDTIGKQIKYQAPNKLIRQASITGDVSVLSQIRNKKLRSIAAGMVSPSGTTLSSLLADNATKELVKVIRTVKTGLINGTSYTKQAAKLKSVFGGNSYNAIRVARTEGTRNMNAGAFANTLELRDEGLNIRRQWAATIDSRTRDTHVHLDGQYEDKNGLFWINGESASYPGGFPSASEDVNCRCMIIDVVEGLEPTIRRGRDPVTGVSDIGNFKNYSDWMSRA